MSLRNAKTTGAIGVTGINGITLNAYTGSKFFNGDVGPTAKPVLTMINKAHGDTVNATMNVGSFT